MPYYPRIAQIITPVLSGFLLENVSYRTLFPYAFLFSTLAFFTMLQVRHGGPWKAARPIRFHSRLPLPGKTLSWNSPALPLHCHAAPCEEFLKMVGGRVPLIVEYKVEWTDVMVCPLADRLLQKYKGVYFPAPSGS